MRSINLGPIRLVMPSIDAAMSWRRALINLKAADLGDPVETHICLASYSALTAAALSDIHDQNKVRQEWGDLARGRAPAELIKDPSYAAAAVSGLKNLGAGYSDMIALGDEIIKWLTYEILNPVEEGEKRAGFFAPQKAD